MKVTKEVVTEYTLELTAEEGKWLKDLMQNPLCDDGYSESTEDGRMRCKFFNALSE
jgi:hypothetical protein